MKTSHHLVAVGLLAAFLCGCGGPREEPKSEVSGTVLMDDKPLDEGEIIFEAEDKSTTPAVCKIVSGRYTVSIVPGPKRVKILASRPVLKPDPVMGYGAKEAIIGPEYNEKTTLKYDVLPGKQDDVDFKVKEMKRTK